MNATTRQIRSGWRDYMIARSLRERVLMLLTAATFIIASGHFLILSPMDEAIAEEQRALSLKHSEIDSMRAATTALIAEYRKDSDAANRARLAELQRALARTDTPLTQLTEGMVAPEEMAKLVEGVLVLNRRLELVDMRNLPPEPLFGNDPGEGGDKTPARQSKATRPDIALYKHGFEITVDGRYTEIVRFLHTLEDLPWKVTWGRLQLETRDYPLSRLVLVVYTFSLREPWLQV